MAGIGFELKKLTTNTSVINLIRANVYAGLLSSGSWVISIGVLVTIYFYLNQHGVPLLLNIQFLVTVTYLVSISLIISAVFQQLVNRYIADQIFLKKLTRITPALFAATLVLVVFNFIFGLILIEFLLPNRLFITKLTLNSIFVILNIIWLFANSLTGLKNYRFILFAYLMCYLMVFLLAINLYHLGYLGLMTAFYSGHIILLICFILFALINYPAKQLLNWDILFFIKRHKGLVYSSVFFQMGVWADKYCFWFFKGTSIPIIDALRSSPIYDMPMFVAFIFMIPGITVLFYEVEANFSRYYHLYYDAVREGGTLQEIYEKQIELVSIARDSFLNIIFIQMIISMLAIYFAPAIFRLLGLAPIFIYLFRIDIISVGLLVLLISLINFLYYLNLEKDVQTVSLLFLIVNVSATLTTIYLGPFYYGYGFALALLSADVAAALKLRRAFEKLTFHSFMPSYSL